MQLSEAFYENPVLLAGIDRRKPKQANLRRAVSAAYYAVFHAVIEQACRALFSNDRARRTASRSFDLGAIREACEVWQKPGPAGKTNKWGKMVDGEPSQDILDLAGRFVKLQEKRHEADYNAWRTFSRTDVEYDLIVAREALDALARAAKDSEQADAFRAFCTALFMHRQFRG